MLLAVNGTLMRGLELNRNLLDNGARFVCTAKTAPVYRLWSIGDRYPAMIRASSGGGPVDLEVWDIPEPGVVAILLQEPPGLSLGKVQLENGDEVVGVLGENLICEGQREITAYGGWRAYLAGRASA